VWLNNQDSNSKESTKKKGEKRDRSSKELDEEEPKGYIHVRARRGQATDSHSLAERVLCTPAYFHRHLAAVDSCRFSLAVWASFCSSVLPFSFR